MYVIRPQGVSRSTCHCSFGTHFTVPFHSLAAPITLLMIVGFVNATNMADGMNGQFLGSVVIWAPHPSNTGRGSQALAGPPSAARGGTPPPVDRNFICIEPMAGVTDAINLAHKGIYKELQSVPAGGTWRESFWVRPGGF